MCFDMFVRMNIANVICYFLGLLMAVCGRILWNFKNVHEFVYAFFYSTYLLTLSYNVTTLYCCVIILSMSTAA